MSASSDPALSKATDAFRQALGEAWGQRHTEEEEIARTYAPASAQVTSLVQAIAHNVLEVTGQPARLDEAKATIHTGRRTLLTHHTLVHPSGDFHVRVLYGPEGIEYHKERLAPDQLEELFKRIVRDALVHFGPKPM